MVKTVAGEIVNETKKREQIRQEAIARQEAGKKAADDKIGQMLLGTWKRGGVGDYPVHGDYVYYMIEFYSDGSFVAAAKNIMGVFNYEYNLEEREGSVE